MPQLKALKNRLSAVISTHKLTKAMQIIAASRFQKLKSMVFHSADYLSHFHEVIDSVIASNDSKYANLTISELYKGSEQITSNIAVIVLFSAEKGLCGKFDSIVMKKLKSAYSDILQSTEVDTIRVVCFAKRVIENARRIGGEKFKNVKIEYVLHHVNVVKGFETFRDDISNSCAKFCSDAKFLYVMYPAFITTVLQLPCLIKLFPLVDQDKEKFKQGIFNFLDENTDRNLYDRVRKNSGIAKKVFALEPSSSIEILKMLIPSYFIALFYNTALEVYVGENASRMIMMDAANRNAEKIQKNLRIQYNKHRQAAITQELIELASSRSVLN
ncbi:ATP synthase gamma chain [Candidatus Fokinia solitaria]|uniref:ATP synthase gamma chain n=1 Tax=Candidatus Fokinia solitaria TaxID=1802984 RepID=A0A2U8BRY1_9RICK|nr:FoF1 ATP synthase subunit gamma [Candidatus Fokinia solitaria]AWD33098.1 ATP synthase gamma chain [Candidatus Fokinia solitaria]